MRSPAHEPQTPVKKDEDEDDGDVDEEIDEDLPAFEAKQLKSRRQQHKKWLAAMEAVEAAGEKTNGC